jgi:hypothetical protein
VTVVVFAKVVLILGVLVASTGLAPSLLVGRTRTWALVLAPAWTGAVCTLGVGLSLATRTALLPWVLLLGLAGWVLLLVQARRGKASLLPPGGDGGWLVLVPIVLVALVPVLLAEMPLTEQDAQAIWWFHAAWFRSGGEQAWSAMHDPAYRYSHPAYPPLVPGVIATVWSLGGAYDREVALYVTQLLNAAGAATLGFVTTRVLRVEGRVGALVGVVVVLVAWGSGTVLGLNGLADLTWALFGVAGAVLVLGGDDDRRTLRTGMLLLLVAAATKTEAQVVVLLVLGAALVRPRPDRRQVLVLGGALVATISAWTVLVRPPGASEDRGDWSKVGDLLSSGSEVQRRFGESVPSLADQLGPLVLVGVLVVVGLVVFARRSGTPLRQPGLLSLLVVAAGYLVFLAVTFPLRDEEIGFLTEVTSYRVVVFVRLVVLVDVVLAVVATARVLGVLPGLGPQPAEGSSGGAGTTTAGASVPPSTSKTLPVTHEPASDAR